MFSFSFSALRRSARRCCRSAGPLGGNLGEHRFVFEQAYAEAFQAVQAGGFGGRFAAQQRPGRRGLVRHRRCASACRDTGSAGGGTGGDPFWLSRTASKMFSGRLMRFGWPDGQFDQFGAEVAQLVHDLLLLGFSMGRPVSSVKSSSRMWNAGGRLLANGGCCPDSDFPALTPLPCPKPPPFSYAFATLQQLAEDVLPRQQQGATACDVDVSKASGSR